MHIIMLDDFPSTPGKDRERLILDIIESGPERISYNWVPLKIEHKEHVGEFLVLADALKIDGIRINVTAITNQLIADRFVAMMLTAKLADHIWHQADIKIKPRPRPITASIKAMIEHSQDIDKQLVGSDCTNKIISTVGKYWILDSKLAKPKVPNQAINYGWHFSGSNYNGISGNVNASLLKDPNNGMYYRVIQPASSHHNGIHSDYSQICGLVARECTIDGIRMDIEHVLKDPELSYIVSHTGVQPILRQPGS